MSVQPTLLTEHSYYPAFGGEEANPATSAGCEDNDRIWNDTFASSSLLALPPQLQESMPLIVGQGTRLSPLCFQEH